MVSAAIRRLACAASPGIADDEGIDHRHRPDHRFRKAGPRQRDRLARQPFQRAVRAHVDDGVDPDDVPQPEPERQQRMARRQGRVVIVRAPARRPAAVGRQRDDGVAEAAGAEAERTGPRIGVEFRRAPGGVDLCANRCRKLHEQFSVSGDRERRCILAAVQRIEQRLRR